MSTSPDRKRKPMCRSVWLRRHRAKNKYDGSRVSLVTTMAPLCQQGGILEAAKNNMPVLELDKFPEDVLHHIHSRVPLRDAARAACVSHRFLRSWRRFPNLTLNWQSFGLNMNEGSECGRAKKLVDIIDTILENHSGNGVKTLKLQVWPCGYLIKANQLDIWLQSAVKSGIEELSMDLPQYYGLNFNFPCSLLSSAASSLQSLSLSYCVFSPTLSIGCLRNMKNVRLLVVRITEEELGCLFSCATNLEKLEVAQCDGIICFKIPSHLQQLSVLRVFRCRNLQMIEIYAPKVSTFSFRGPPTKMSISNSSQLKNMSMNGACCSGMFHHVLTKFHSIASNLQTLILLSSKEAGQPYVVPQEDSVLEDSNADPSQFRSIPEFHLDSLKKVSILGFCSAKSLIELTCQILKTSSSLQRLVLDTTGGYDNTGICENMDRKSVMEALRGVEVIKRYIKGKVSSTINFEVLEPCDRCHIPKL